MKLTVGPVVGLLSLCGILAWHSLILSAKSQSRQTTVINREIPLSDILGGTLNESPWPAGLVNAADSEGQRTDDGWLFSDLGIGSPGELHLLIDPMFFSPATRIELKLRGALSGGGAITQDGKPSAALPASSWPEWSWIEVPWTSVAETDSFVLSLRPVLGFVEVAAIRFSEADAFSLGADGSSSPAPNVSTASDELATMPADASDVSTSFQIGEAVPSATVSKDTSIQLPATAVTWHVNANIGRDDAPGLSKERTLYDGPLRTVRSALQKARDGDCIVIAEGNYGENLDVAGLDVNLVFEGTVNFY